MKTTSRMIETLAMLTTWATLALAGSACENPSAIATAHPDSATPAPAPHATGGTVATTQAVDPIPDAAPVVPRADAAPIVADADPVMDADPPVADGPVVLGSCGVGLEEILAAGVASCVPIPGFVPDAAPDVVPTRCNAIYPNGILSGNSCVFCNAGTCYTSTCGNGIVEGGEECDCGNNPAMVPSGCEGANGVSYHDGKACSLDCLRMD